MEGYTVKNLLKILSISLLFIGGLVACGPDEANEANENVSNNNGEMPEKPDKLKLWVNDEEKQKEAVEDITDLYTEETGIEVELTPVDMLDQVEKLDVEGPAGNGPDIIFQPHDRIGDLVIRGLVDPVDLDNVEKEYTEAALEAVNFENEYWGFPAVTETYTMYYNESLVDEAPETMKDLMDIATNKTDENNDEYGFLMEANNYYYVHPFFAGFGGYVFGVDDDGSYAIDDIGLNNEGSVEGGELIQSWFDDGYMPKDLTEDIMNGLFKEGKVATVITGPWMAREFSNALGDDLNASIIPILDNGENPKSLVGVKSYMLSSYSEEKEWAQDLMEFMTNKENSLHYYEVAGEMPPRTDSLEDEVITDDKIFSAFAEQIEFGEPMPNDPAVQQIWDPINDALDFIAEGEPVDEVLDEAVEMIQEQIEASGAYE